MNSGIIVSLSNALRDYFRNELSSPTELSDNETEEERRKRLAMTEVISDSPPIVVLSISERVSALAMAMESGVTDNTPHKFPKNWSTASFTDMQHGNGGSHIGTAYINNDTGREFMIERDGVRYWL